MEALVICLEKLLGISFNFFGYSVTFGQFFYFTVTAVVVAGFIRGILD